MAERQLQNLGAAIEDARKEKGLSRSGLARLIPVEAKTVERWEKGRTGGAMENLRSIANSLGTTTDDLLAAAAAKGSPTPQGNADLMDSLKDAEASGSLGPVEEQIDSTYSELSESLDRLHAELAEIRKLLEPVARTRKGTGN